MLAVKTERYSGKRRRPDLALGSPWNDHGLGLSRGSSSAVDAAVNALANRIGSGASYYANRLAAKANRWLSGPKRSKSGPAARSSVSSAKTYTRRPRMTYKRKRGYGGRKLKKGGYKKYMPKGTTKSKFGRVGHFTNMVNKIPPNAVSYFQKKIFLSGSLFYNVDNSGAALTGFVRNWVLRANDIIQPTCVTGDEVTSGGSTWLTNFNSNTRTSALGVNRIAPMYREHVVQKFTYSMKFHFRNPNGAGSSMLNPIIAWRISDDPPTEIDNATSSTDLVDNVLNSRMTGWRYRQFTLDNVKSKFVSIKGTIPIRKFYRYPLFTRDEQADQQCSTVSTTPSQWTSPKNPCYFQCVLFVKSSNYSETVVPDYLDGGNVGVSTSTTTLSINSSWIIPYSCTMNFGFLTRSTERDQDILNQSTTTDGGVDASGETELPAISSTWTADVLDT